MNSKSGTQLAHVCGRKAQKNCASRLTRRQFFIPNPVVGTISPFQIRCLADADDAPILVVDEICNRGSRQVTTNSLLYLSPVTLIRGHISSTGFAALDLAG
jgi:hypothetical protein